MPINKFALLRYRIIDKCIRNKFKPYPTKVFLLAKCEESLYGDVGNNRISESTIDKDIWSMRNEGELGFYAPIKFSKVHQGYYYEDENYSIENIPLGEDEIEAIKFAAQTLFQFKEIDLFKQYESIIEKIIDRLDVNNSNKGNTENIVQFETAPTYYGSEYLKVLIASIREKKEIKFVYQRFDNDSEKEYLFHPYLLKEYRNRWYLIGKNKDKSNIVTFGLDRIKSLSTLNTIYTIDKNFNPDIYFKYAIGITSNDNLPKNVILSFKPLAGKYVKTQPLHHTQKILIENQTEFKITIQVLITNELLMQLLSYGADVKIIEPKELINMVITALKKSMDQY
jgi:predicted DNA-binding transcriptional regulator YafY